MITNELLLQAAIKDHQAGKMREAEVGYRRILAAEPGQPVAMHYLGVLALQSGHVEDAIELMRRSVEAAPGMADFQGNFAMALRRAGRLDDAIAAMRKMVSLKPNSPQGHSTLGGLLQQAGRPSEAIGCYRKAIELNPNLAEAQHNLGAAFLETGDSAGALEAFDRVLLLQPSSADTHSARGGALRRLGREAESLEAYDVALKLDPKCIEAYIGRGNLCKDLHRLDEAEWAYRKAVELAPKWVQTHLNLGVLLRERGDVAAAIECFDRALEIDPASPEAHWNRGIALLLKGDFSSGFVESEWRWKCRDFPGRSRNLGGTEWDGSPLAGRTILLHAEQGLGDTLQFVRYAVLIARTGKVVLECQPELKRVLSGLEGVSKVIGRGETLPRFDVRAPLMSLPLLFGTTLQTVPAHVPYILPSKAAVESWRQRLNDSPTRKIGLVWAGGRANPNDRDRSMHFDLLAPIITQIEAMWISLQKGDAVAQLHASPLASKVMDAAPLLEDFEDTAGVIAALDLVITVDTAVAHLAGAMAKPVWLMLAHGPDFRWMLNRSDSPWYPTATLFRQETAGNWQTVTQLILKRLAS